MQGCHPEERQEVDHVTLSDACAHPWAMMILLLDADSTSAAMERSRWAEQIAGCAETECVGFDLGPTHSRDAESVLSEVVFYIVRNEISFIFTHVFYSVVVALVHFRSRNCWNYTWLGICTCEEDAKDIDHASGLQDVNYDS